MNQYYEEVINPGDEISRLAKEVCFQSHGNCPAVFIVPHDVKNFRGPVGFLWRKELMERMLQYECFVSSPGSVSDWQLMEEVENDGAGGKPQFFTLVGTPEVFHNLGWEIITMTADDFARSGRFPCIMINDLQVKKATKQNFPLVRAMFDGYSYALNDANLVNITGETAIMKRSITAFCDVNTDDQLILTWSATCIGLADKYLLFNPSMIEAGMPIVGFLEKGYRCNGGGFFADLLLREFGNARNIMASVGAMAFVKKLTVPSKSYAKTMSRLTGWQTNGDVGDPLANIMAAAHITGGGVWGKFGEILPQGIGAHLNNMPEPPRVLLQAQEKSLYFPDLALSDENFYGTFHGGCGMIMVAATDKDADRIIYEASRDYIQAQIIGRTNNSGKLTIVSHALQKKGKELSPPEN